MFISICLMCSSFLGVAIPYIIKTTSYSFLYTLLFSFIFGLLLTLVFLKIFNCKPDKNIFEKIDSTIIKTILLLLVFCLVIIVFFRFSSFIANEYLTETPAYLICLLLAFPIYIAMFKDIDTAGRCATSITYATFILFIISRLSLVSKISFINFKPIIISDFISTIKASLVVSVLNVGPLFTTLIIPKDYVVDKENVNKKLIISYIISFIILSLITITIVGILGINISKLYTFPSYIVLKSISILNFIKNVQNFSVLFWIMFMSFTCAFYMLFIREGIRNTFINNNNKLFIIMRVLFLVFIVSIVYIVLPCESYINRFNNLYAYIPFILYGLLLVVCLISILFRKNDTKN